MFDEIGFRKWLAYAGIKSKVISDHICRLKRIEKETGPCDIDFEYGKDRCHRIMSMFLNMGLNDEMRKFPESKLPIGKYYMSTYRYSLRLYICFCDSNNSLE